MAVMAFISGSVLGFFVGLIGWLFWDISLLAAFGFYVATALAFGLLPLIAVANRRDTYADSLALAGNR